MNRILLFAFILLLFSSKLSAQLSSKFSKEKSEQFIIGNKLFIKSGINFTNQNLTKTSIYSFIPQSGFQIGIGYTKCFKNKLSLELGLEYIKRSYHLYGNETFFLSQNNNWSELKISDLEYNFNYLDFPILLKYNFSYFQVGAGISPMIKISEKINGNIISHTINNITTIEYSNDKINNHKSYNLPIQLSLDLQIFRSLWIGADFKYGIFDNYTSQKPFGGNYNTFDMLFNVKYYFKIPVKS